MSEDIHEVPSSTTNFKTEFAKQLEEIAPEAITDGKVDVTKLKELLDGDAADESERFGLFWPGKRDAIHAAQEPTTATLKPEPALSKDWDSTQNVFIEGDNLEVLKILQKHYHGKIKMIYIDPPYNTGKDFVYPDNYKEGLQTYLQWTKQVNAEGKKLSTNTESNGRFHSRWLNMMYPRLKLARSLLTIDGVICISIDDHEQEHLKEICLEIFGERNFISEIVWTNKEGGGSSDSKTFKRKHEYILVFARDINFVSIQGIPVGNPERYTMSDQYEPTRGKYYTQKLGMGTIQYSPSLDYPIQTPDGHYVMPADNNSGKTACWRWSKNKVAWGIKNGYVVFKKNKDNQWIIYTKQYLCADNDGNIINRTQRPSTVIDSFSTTQASKGIRKLFGGIDFFDYTKPVDLIRHLVNICASPGATVLDFFSGSGTTAHAIMQLNAEDNGERHHIQVQLPEPVSSSSDAAKAGFKTIAEIARKRIDRAGEKIQQDYLQQLSLRGKSLDIGYRTYKLIDSNFSKWHETSDSDATTFEQHLLDLRENADDNADQLSLLSEILLKQGYSLSEQIKSIQINELEVLSVSGGLVLAYVNEHVKPTLSQLRTLIDQEPERLIILEDAFQGDDELKTNLVQLAKSKHVNLWTA